MNPTIESMESRRLLSAAAGVIGQDLVALQNDATTATADLKAGLATVAADAKSLKSAAAAAHPTAAQKKLVTKLQKDQTVATSTFTKQITTLINSGLQNGKRLNSLLKSLQRNPTNASLRSKVGAALGSLQAVFSTQKVAAVENNLQSLGSGIDTDLNSLAAAVPSTQSLVSKTEGDLAASLTTVSTELSSIQAGIAKLTTDLA